MKRNTRIVAVLIALMSSAILVASTLCTWAIAHGASMRWRLLFRALCHGIPKRCLELWSVPIDAFGSFVAEVPAPLAIGTVTLDDGREVKGFVCESYALAGALDISSYGGWRNFLSAHPAGGGRLESGAKS